MSFKDRERQEESKYRHSEEMRFKIRNRRNKLFGLWLAENHLGKTGDAALDYAKDVVMADFERPGDGDVLDKVREDLNAANVQLSDHLLEKHLAECEAEARQQVMSE